MLAVVPASAFAEYNFYTYGNGAMLYSTLNAVAMIFNDSGFISLTRLVFTLAFLASFYMTAFLKRWDVLKYAIISFFILGLFLYSKDRVVIHDVIQDELYVVDNVPKAFGFFGEYVSSPGHFITEEFDTGFVVPITTLLFGKSNAMPPNLTYSGSGFAGPFKMIKDLGSFELPDQQIQADFYEYVKKCAKWDVMGLNSSEMKFFKENLNLSSPDVIPAGLSSRFYVPVTIGGVKSQCATYYVANLYPRLVASIGGSEAILSSEPKLLKYMSGLSSSMAFFTGESLTTYNAMTQSAVVKTAIRSLSGSLANGREEYNQFMAEMGIAKFEQQGEVISRVAMKLIPIFRNVMEILMIATLPIVFLLFLLPNGYKLIWEYILSLIWLQLWNPILAVMQMVMNLSAVMEASAAGKVTEIGGFTIHSFGYWGDFSNSYLAVAGYMMISVPMLAHLVLRGGKFMGAQLGQGLASAAMGAGAMSVDPNAVKGAGYLTAEEKALNESGIEKMFMIQNMHNAGAARNIDSARAYEKRAEASAEMGIDPMSGYAGLKADAQTQNELAGMKTANELKGNYGSNAEVAQVQSNVQVQDKVAAGNSAQELKDNFGGNISAGKKLADVQTQNKGEKIINADITKDAFGGNMSAAEAKGIAGAWKQISETRATLGAPQGTLNALYEGRDAVKGYEQEAARQGNYQLAGEFQAMRKVMDSQIQKYDSDGNRTVDQGKELTMMEDIAAYNYQTNASKSLGSMAGTKEFDTPAAQAFAIASLAENGNLRETLGKASGSASTSYKDQIEKGSRDSADMKARNAAMLEQYGNFNAYQRAQYNSHMMSQSNLKGQIQAWDLDGDGHISKGEAQAGMEKFAYMGSLMNKSEAQEFWQTFENNPDAAMDALNMKYGVQAESMKAFQETANARGLTDTQLGQIMANEDIYKAEYNEGKNMLIQNLARELGTGEAALKASDGKFYAVGMFAENLYEQTRDGKITQDEAAKQLTEYMGAARAVAAASKDTLDTGALAAGSFLKETEVGGKEAYERGKELYKNWDPENSDTGTPESNKTIQDLEQKY
jgi:hypothetical protein